MCAPTISEFSRITQNAIKYKRPNEVILTTVKQGNYDGSDQVAAVKRSYKPQYQGKEKEEGKRKDGKTTSESGPVSTSTTVREQHRTVSGGRRLSPMSSVVPLRPMVPGHR